MLSLTTNKDTLRKRLRRLIGEYDRTRSTTFSEAVLPLFNGIGKLALIGGAARDVAREGVAKFRSDFDFVLYDSDDLGEFYSLMKRLNSERNKFGGYGIEVGRWRMDVWALEDTWARTAGVRRVERLHDLLDCTFFNVDAIIFDLESGKILTKNSYFTDLRDKILEINLEENPNPRGSVVRAIRRATTWNATLGPRLKVFLRRALQQYSWQELVELDASAFRYPILDRCRSDGIYKSIFESAPLAQSEIGYRLESDGRQLELPLP